MLNALEDSLHQILRCEKQELGRGFYSRLFQEVPQAARFFDSIDLRGQANILVNSLHMIVCHAVHGYPAAAQYLKLLGARHRTRGIPPEMFPQFAICLLGTIADFHGETWNEGLAGAWTSALESAIQVMLEGYDETSPTY